MDADWRANVPFRLPLTREQFCLAIQKGQGRALMHARQFGVRGLEDTLIEACVCSQAYDAQCEDERSQWLVNIIDAAQVEQQLVPQVLDRFRFTSEETTFWDLRQRSQLARIFAGRGHGNARTLLYQLLQKDARSLDLIGAEEIIDLDGADGLMHVAQTMGRWLAQQPGLHLDDAPITWYDERHGEGSAIRLLEAFSHRDEHVGAYLKHLQADTTGHEDRRNWFSLDQARIDPEKAEERRRKERSLHAADVISDIETSDPDQNHMKFMGWGRKADEDDLREVAGRIFATPHPGRLIKYLCIFTRRPLPEFDNRLLALADHENKDVRWRAIRVLSNHQHPEIRQLALRRLAEGRAGEGILRLFRENYLPGDHLLLEQTLAVLPDRHDVHTLASDMLDIFKQNATPESKDAMLFVYEHTPCSNCRGSAVEILLRAKQAPDWVIRECEHDADDHTREVVSQLQE